MVIPSSQVVCGCDQERPCRYGTLNPGVTRTTTVAARDLARGRCHDQPMTSTGERGLVLVVEDDRAIAELVALYLRRDGFGVLTESDGEAALAAVRRHRPVAIVLDVGLPGMDGVEVCRRLRAGQDRTPVLFVTARDDEVDRILGLEIGGDDYVTKPFSPRELAVRVRTVLRRTGAMDGEVLVVGGIRLDVARRRVHARDEEVSLTATEFDLLAHLMRAPGRVFSREQLLSAV
jgi:DNA-binding response OmpR family regulator